METLRRSIRENIHSLVGSRAGRGTPAPPPADGLFPRDAACRRVHGDFTSMMIGGVSALLLQMLHPSALAGVWDHSNFRQDILGRLRRTAQFISATTFGSVETAEQTIRRVRAIHNHVHGTLPNGRPYSANDPEVLAWVHVAGASSFLASYLRYTNPAFPPARQNQYLAETAEIARRLGATGVPESLAELQDYLRRTRRNLGADERTFEIQRAILGQPASNLVLAPFQRLVLAAGIDLLPDWAARMHRLHVPRPSRPALRAGILGASAVVRWALNNPSGR